MTPEEIQRKLCKTFCTSISVAAVPCGYAISSPFTDRSGDPIEFYITESADGLRIEDDGDYLTHLIAIGIDIESGMRSKLLDAILEDGEAIWDRDSYEIRTRNFGMDELVQKSIKFISSLIRLRDLEFLTREAVKSTFREDALNDIYARFESVANLNEKTAVVQTMPDYPCDILIEPKNAKRKGAVYFVSNTEQLLEADLLRSELRIRQIKNVSVIALIEDIDMPTINRRKFQRAQNRGLVMPFYRGDETASIDRIAEETLEVA